jgi:hypothetical protein
LFSDFDRQDEHRATVLVKAALQLKHRVVVQRRDPNPSSLSWRRNFPV